MRVVSRLTGLSADTIRVWEPGEAHELIAGISSLAKQHEVWLGIPEQHELSRFPPPARLLHRYEDLDIALTTQPVHRRENLG